MACECDRIERGTLGGLRSADVDMWHSDESAAGSHSLPRVLLNSDLKPTGWVALEGMQVWHLRLDGRFCWSHVCCCFPRSPARLAFTGQIDPSRAHRRRCFTGKLRGGSTSRQLSAVYIWVEGYLITLNIFLNAISHIINNVKTFFILFCKFILKANI